MEILKGVACMIGAALLMVAIYIGGWLLGWFFFVLSILGVAFTVMCVIAYAIHEGVTSLFSRKK